MPSYLLILTNTKLYNGISKLYIDIKYLIFITKLIKQIYNMIFITLNWGNSKGVEEGGGTTHYPSKTLQPL